jgi:thiol-disulfide isomerase/thioredoxin
MNFRNIALQYKTSLLFRIVSQSLLLIVVYTGIQLWQSVGAIKGAAPLIIDQTIDGDEVDLRRYQSSPVVVYFWADWCPVCKFETPVINNLAQDYQVLSVATFAENKQDIINYLQDEGINMPVIFDEHNEWAKLYNVSAVPSTFIIDAKGNVRFVEKGYTSSIGLRLRLWWVH